MTRDELLAELRNVLDDTGADPGWSDARLIRFLSEGQDKFCEETGFFVDFGTYTIETVAGIARYELPERIIQVMEVWDGARRLRPFGQSQKTVTEGPEIVPPQAGIPTAWQTDEATGFITFHPVPNEPRTLTLRSWRYPITPLDNRTGGVYDAQPEIPVRFRRACVEYGAFLALMNHDAERQDKVKAADHLAAFNLIVADGVKAFNRSRGVRSSLGGNPLYVLR